MQGGALIRVKSRGKHELYDCMNKLLIEIEMSILLWSTLLHLWQQHHLKSILFVG